MADTQDNLQQLQQLFLSAKDKMVAKQKKPPNLNAPVELKEKTLSRLKRGVENLNAAKLEAIKEFDQQIQAQQKRIALLEKEIKEDRKKLNLEDKRKKPTPKKRQATKKPPEA